MSDLDNSLAWLDALKWDDDGMIPAIAQDEKRAGRDVCLDEPRIAAGNGALRQRGILVAFASAALAQG